MDYTNLVGAITGAYLNKANFENDVLLPLDKTWETTSGDSRFDKGLYEILEYYRGQGQLISLLNRVAQMKPGNAALQAHILELVPAAIPGFDIYATRRLNGDLLMVNRADLRESVRNLDVTSGPRVLQIFGPMGSGKTHSLEYLYYLKEAGGDAFDVYGIDLQDFVGRGPMEFANVILRKVEIPQKPVTNLEMDARISKDLAEEIAVKTTKSKRRQWFVFDNFDRALVLEPIRNFIYALAHWASTEHRMYLRVVLLDCQQKTVSEELALSFYKKSVKEKVDYLTEDHVYDHMVAELNECKIQFNSADVRAAAKAFFTQASTGSVFDADLLVTSMAEWLRRVRQLAPPPTKDKFYNYIVAALNDGKIKYDPTDMRTAVNKIFTDATPGGVMNAEEVYKQLWELLRKLRGLS